MAHAAVLLLAAATAGGTLAAAPVGGARSARALLQTWDRDLERAKATPVEKVVSLLKSMQDTLGKEMDQDQKLYEKLKCWCDTNSWNKGNAIEESKEKIEKLNADIESLSAKKEELTALIKEVQTKTASEKESLAEAQAIRDKQLKEFHATELDDIQAVENLKAAITILGKHHGEGVFSQFPALSLLSLRQKEEPWTEAHERAQVGHTLDEFMQRNGFGLEAPSGLTGAGRFLQQDEGAALAAGPSGWSAQDAAVVRRALQAGTAWIQTRHEQAYYPGYEVQSGEILGVLKQLKDEMEASLSEAQKTEAARAEEFSILRAAKSKMIEAGEKMEEQKEDELAKTANELAEAKEDLTQEKVLLEENEAFLKNMKETCANADKAWEERKATRQAEMEAVAETIEILTADEAKDAAAGIHLDQQGKVAAASALRRAALHTKNSQLSMLATAVELDAFEKVKKAIDDMITMLKQQQSDEVKKNDWCKAEFKENEMTTLKTEDRKADLEAKIAELASDIKSLEEAIAEGKDQIDKNTIALQSASLSRKEENLDYQKTVADQTVVISVLKKALERLAKFYEGESLLQRGKEAPGSVAPVAQMTYEKSQGAGGVMQMLEKLISEAEELMAESKKGENEAQAAYEKLIADTNGAIAALQKEVVTKTKTKAKATKQKQQAEADLAATVAELEGLDKYKQDLHAECDFLLHNFDARQGSRGQEVEALQQAKQILNGASLS